MDYPIASDLSYLVLKQQRKEMEFARLQSHGTLQHRDAVITGTRADCLRERLSDEIQPTLYEGRASHE